MTAVMHGTLEAAKLSGTNEARSAFFGLAGGARSKGMWGPQGFYLRPSDFELARPKPAGGVLVTLRDTELHVSLDEEDWRLQGQDDWKEAVFTWRRWEPPPSDQVRAWKTPEGHRWETADPSAAPMGPDWVPIEPLGWDHDHCEFCWAKFMEPGSSEEARRYVEEDPDVFTEGYAATEEHPNGLRYHWVCPRCFDDFADRFGWAVIEG